MMTVKLYDTHIIQHVRMRKTIILELHPKTLYPFCLFLQKKLLSERFDLIC